MSVSGLGCFGVLKEKITDCSVVLRGRGKVVNEISQEDHWINYHQRFNHNKGLNICQ